MKIQYSPSVDALYIEMAPGDEKAERTDEVADGVYIDIGVGGRVLGIEVLDASERLGFPRGRLEVSLEQAMTTAAVSRRG